MSWTAVSFILRLLAGIAVGFLLLQVVGILHQFLVAISVSIILLPQQEQRMSDICYMQQRRSFFWQSVIWESCWSLSFFLL